MFSTSLTFPVSASIGTHDGTFHCDEAMACWMLKQLPEFRDASIVRTRDSALLDSLPIVVDVGAVYDPSKGRFDHHQRGFNETLDASHTMKLSSAGLIYKHFGRRVIGSFCAGASDGEIDRMHSRIYSSLIEALDGIDNGISQYPDEVKPKYQENTNLSNRVSRLNPRWNEEVDASEYLKRFHRAMEMCGEEFVSYIDHLWKSWMPARKIVEQALLKRFELHPSGLIMLLETPTEWKSHLVELEQEMKIEPILYALYRDISGKWRIQAVPESEKSFNQRKSLPEPWRGIRDEQLSQLSGIPGCIFVHAGGFIGGAHTFESVLKMAVKALEWDSSANGAEQKKQKLDQ